MVIRFGGVFACGERLMANTLLSGPAGADKSAEARRLLREATEPAIAADFQAVIVALLLLVRGPDGKYPLRPSWVLGLAEEVRQSIIDAATAREISIVITTSDGDPLRRRTLLDRLGAGATERIIDPGEEIVRSRLADPISGVLSPECEKAIARWFGRVNRGGD